MTGFSSMHAFAALNRFQHVLLFGSACGNLRPLWLALFRRTTVPFTIHEGCTLEMAWPHLERGTILNRFRHLERLVRRHESRAAALVNRRGFIDAADQRFLEMLAVEWPAMREGPLPATVLKRFHAGLPYEGTRIRLVPHGQDEVIVCKAYERDRLGALTPAELAVARQFSRGLTHKDVALRLGVSENTVRTHIRHVYDKLSIHNKAHLVQLMGSGSG